MSADTRLKALREKTSGSNDNFDNRIAALRSTPASTSGNPADLLPKPQGNGYVSVADLNRQSNGSGTGVSLAGARGTFRNNYGYGNLDLTDRPIYVNPDGSYSTVRSLSVGFDDDTVLIPTVGWDANRNPVSWTEDEAIQHYLQTGEHLGKFATVEAADQYGQWLHNQQEAYYNNNPTVVALRDRQKNGKSTVAPGTPGGGGRGVTPTDVKTGWDYVGSMQREVGEALANSPVGVVQRNAFAGTAGAVRDIGNALGYIGQMQAQTAMMQADPYLRMWGQDELADKNAAHVQNVRENGYQPLAQVLEGAGVSGAGNVDRDYREFIETAGADAQNGSKVLRVVSQTANGVGGMVPNILANAIVPGSGMWALAARAFGGATEKAIDAGASNENAVLYGGAVAAVEVLTEMMFDGIPGLRSNGENVLSVSKGVENIIGKYIKSEAAQTAILSVLNILGEGAEEFVAEFGDWGLNKLLVGDDNRTLSEVHKDAWYSAFIGALTSFVMSTPSAILNTMSAKQMADAVMQTEEMSRKYKPDYFDGMTEEEARAEFRRLSKEYHPDLHPNDANAAKYMAEITDAYNRYQNTQKATQTEQPAAQKTAQRATPALQQAATNNIYQQALDAAGGRPQGVNTQRSGLPQYQQVMQPTVDTQRAQVGTEMAQRVTAQQNAPAAQNANNVPVAARSSATAEEGGFTGESGQRYTAQQAAALAAIPHDGIVNAGDFAPDRPITASMLGMSKDSPEWQALEKAGLVWEDDGTAVAPAIFDERARRGESESSQVTVFANRGGVPQTTAAKTAPVETPANALPLEQRVTGDALYDAQDLIDTVRDVGAEVDDNGYITVYHRTSPENAERIRQTGVMKAKEDGVFFSTKENGENEGYGSAVVALRIPAEKLELDDIFDDEAHVKIPLGRQRQVNVAEYLVKPENTVYNAGNEPKEGMTNGGEETAGSVRLGAGLRTGSGDGEDVRGRVPGEVERHSSVEGSRQALSRRSGKETVKVNDRGAAKDPEVGNLTFGDEVDASYFGIKDANPNTKFRIVTSGETQHMKNARNIASGSELIAYSGDEFSAGGKNYIEAGWSRKTNKIFAPVNSKLFTIDHYVGHEVCHREIDRGNISIKSILDQAKVELSAGSLEAAEGIYDVLYPENDGLENLTELICDAAGNMNRIRAYGWQNVDRFIDTLDEVLSAIHNMVDEATGGMFSTVPGIKDDAIPTNNSVAQADNPQALRNFNAETGMPDDLGQQIETPTDELKFSRSFDSQYMEAAIKANDKLKNVKPAVMKKAQKDRESVKEQLDKVSDMLPPDITGNTWYQDSSYGGSEENSTVCVRSLAYEEFMDSVAEQLGRPLTVSDTVFISQEAMAMTDKPECLYCYVAMDRKSYRQFLGEYIDQRDAFLADVKAGKEVGLVEPVKKGTGSRLVPKGTAYGDFLNGRANTPATYRRAKLWLDSGKLITKKDLASASAMNKAAQGDLKAQIADAQAYAQSASWAKKKNGYAAYNNHILKWSAAKVKKLNQMYGMRMYSFSDYSPAFILENMQMVTDAAVKGLKVLAYSKELDFVRIFAPTGMNINISVFGYNDGKGGAAMDAMQGADWEQAKLLREQYPNVGCTFVATNDKQVDWALAQDWIDVVIPFHLVRTGAKVADMFGWTNYTQMESDKKNPNWTPGNKDHIYPNEHQNDKAAYLELCEENNLTPRFEKWVDNPNYMKLVNETRLSEAETPAVQPIFNTEYAEGSIKEMVKRGGYMQHIGGTTENMNELAKETAAKIRAKDDSVKYSTAPDAGAEERLKALDKKYLAAVDGKDMETAQRMVDAAAKEWGAVTGKNDKPLTLYHGTPAFGFTKFSTDAIFTTPDRGVAEGYGGGKGYANARRISETYTPDDGTDETLIQNVKNILHQNAHKATKADLDRVKAEISKKANELSSAAADAWDYGNGFPEMPSDVENGLQYLLTLPGEIAETIDELFTGDYPSSEIQSTINGINKYREATRSWFAEHRSEIKAAGNEDLYRIVMGFDLTDFAIDSEYTLLPALDSDNYLVGESGGFASKEGLRDRVEQAKDLGAYYLYGNVGDNPLVIDAKGAFWASVHAPMFGENTMLTDDIVRKAKAAGYTSLVIKNVMDPAMNNYSPNRVADDYIFFDSESVKSADPVTYDDNGNVIPLSERFNPEHEDIRYSTAPSISRLEAENESLRKRLAEARAETKVTKGWKADPQDVAKVSKSIAESANSKISQTVLQNRLTKLVEDASNGEISDDEITAEAGSIAQAVVEKSEALASKDLDSYNAANGYLKKVYISVPQELRDRFDDFKFFAGTHKMLQMKHDGVPIKDVYAELQRDLGTDYFPDMPGEKQMLEQMGDVMESLTPVYGNQYSFAMQMVIEEMGNEILTAALDVGQKITYADKANAKLQDAKAENKATVEKLKTAESYIRSLQRIATRRMEQNEALKQHYADTRKRQKEARELRQSQDKLLRVLKRLNNRKLPMATKNEILDAQNAIAGVIDTIGKSFTGEIKAKRYTEQGITDVGQLQDWVYRKTTEGVDPAVYDPNFIVDGATKRILDRLKMVSVKDLTAIQVKELTQALLNIEARIAADKKAVDSQLAMEFYQAGTQVMHDIDQAKPGHLQRKLRPLSAFLRMADYNDNSPLVILYKEMLRGEEEADVYRREAIKPFSTLLSDHKWLKDMYGKDAKTIMLTGTDIDGHNVTVEITPMMRIALYLHSLNDDNFRHLYEGGIVVPDMKWYRKGDLTKAYNEGTTVHLSRPILQRLAEQMTPKERQFAKLLQNYYNDFAPKRMNPVSLALDGYEKFTVEDYYPLNTDRNFLNADYEAKLFAADASLARPGWGEERIKSKKPVVLYDANTTFLKMLAQNSMYAHQAIPLHNMNRLLNVQLVENRDSVKAAMNRQFPDGSADKYVSKFMSDYAGHRRSDNADVGRLLDKLRSNYSGGVLLMALSTAGVQAASYPTAAAVVSPASLIKALNPTKINLDFIDKRTAIYTKRTEGLAMMEMAELREQGKHIPKVLNWIQGVDMATTSLLKRAAYWEIRDTRKDLRPGTEEFEKAVVDMYLRIIEETQPNYSAALRPDILRSDNAMERALIMFATQPLQQYNIAYDAVGRYESASRHYKTNKNEETKAAKKQAAKGVGRAFGVLLASSLAFALLRLGTDTIMGNYEKKYKPDEKSNDTDMEAFLRQFGMNMLGSITGMWPIGKTLVEFVEATTDTIATNLGGKAVFGKKWYGVETATVGAINDALDSFATAVNYVSRAIAGKSETKTAVKKVVATAEDFAVLFGIPAANVHKLVKAIAHWAGVEEDELYDLIK